MKENAPTVPNAIESINDEFLEKVSGGNLKHIHKYNINQHSAHKLPKSKVGNGRNHSR